MRQNSGCWLSLEPRSRGRRLRFTSSEESSIVSLSISSMRPCLCSTAEFGCNVVAGTVNETGMLIGATIGNIFGKETNDRGTLLIEGEEIFEDELEIEKAFIVLLEFTKVDKTKIIKINKPKNNKILIAN